MSLIYFGLYVIMSLFQGVSARIYKEGDNVEVECVPPVSDTLVFWFRIKEDSSEYLLTTKSTDRKASANDRKYTFRTSDKKLVVHSFNKATDSGLYTCAAMNNNMLLFGKIFTVMGEPDPTPQHSTPKLAPVTTKGKIDIVTTTPSPCACKKEPQSPLNCETWMFSSMVSCCGLLLLLLIITILYCNRLRTRRCPHHYKKRPQNRPAGNAKQPHNHI